MSATKPTTADLSVSDASREFPAWLAECEEEEAQWEIDSEPDDPNPFVCLACKSGTAFCQPLPLGSFDKDWEVVMLTHKSCIEQPLPQAMHYAP